MALSMIEGAERRGTLKAGEKFKNTTGKYRKLVMVCAMKGYHACFVSSNAFASCNHAGFRTGLELIRSEDGKITASY
jgi:cysteine synthase A